MSSKSNCRLSLSLSVAVLIISGFGSSAFSAGGCFTGPAKVPDADIAAFTGKPDALLSDFPTAGQPMTTKVRSLAGSSDTALDSLMSLVAQASSSQKSALGSGLGAAAKSCQSVSPDYAQLIQQKVALANDKDLTAAFTASLNDVQTAALGGGAGGAGGGGGGGLAGGGAAGGSSGGTAAADAGTSSTSGDFSVGTRGAFAQAARTTIVVSPN